VWYGKLRKPHWGDLLMSVKIENASFALLLSFNVFVAPRQNRFKMLAVQQPE